MSTANYPSTISNLLQDQWSLTSPLNASAINWPLSKQDTINSLNQKTPMTQLIIIGCYNGAPARSVERPTRQLYLIVEKVVIEVNMTQPSNSSDSIASTEANLEEVTNEIYRILHMQNITPNSRSVLYDIDSEPTHVNNDRMLRNTINVLVSYMHIAEGTLT